MTLLEVDRVSKRFGGVPAVQDVSFTVAPGELVGIMGPNGSGKTTLFDLVAGALAPDAGEIRFGGRVISGLASHRVDRTAPARPRCSSPSWDCSRLGPAPCGGTASTSRSSVPTRSSSGGSCSCPKAGGSSRE